MAHQYLAPVSESIFLLLRNCADCAMTLASTCSEFRGEHSQLLFIREWPEVGVTSENRVNI